MVYMIRRAFVKTLLKTLFKLDPNNGYELVYEVLNIMINRDIRGEDETVAVTRVFRSSFRIVRFYKFLEKRGVKTVIDKEISLCRQHLDKLSSLLNKT